MTVSRRLLLPRAFPMRVRRFGTGWLRIVCRALVVTFISWFAAGPAIAGPLHEAAREGDAGKVADLLAQGVDVNGRDENRETPLIAAALT
ncbi:MAG: ankyrin repeat domain-containing protein, partial [Mesorhizobium sp.]